MTHDVLVLLALWFCHVASISHSEHGVSTDLHLWLSAYLFPPLLSCRRYYKETSGLMLDVGGYMKALEVPAMVCPMPPSGFLEKRERFTYKKPFMRRASNHTLPPLWSWLSHCLGHHTVSHMSVILSSQPWPTSW